MYVPGSRAAAPAAYYPPAPAPGPLQALGPLGSQAQTAAQNTSFGETQLSGVGPIYKKQDSLEPVSHHNVVLLPKTCSLRECLGVGSLMTVQHETPEVTSRAFTTFIMPGCQHRTAMASDICI